MNLPLRWISCIGVAILACQCAPLERGYTYRGHSAYTPVASNYPVVSRTTNLDQLWREINLVKDMVPRGSHGRRVVRPMTPRYITVHSTQNYSSKADAKQHALALKRGALRSPRRRGGNRIGYLIWHYSIDEDRVVQHMPTYEQGEHADFDGPGNRYSIGVEMCENRGNSRRATIERTAKLCAALMHEHNIPLRNVVPHYHWPRRGKNPAHKNCPHFLLDDGKPGRKWRWFQSRVRDYHRQYKPIPAQNGELVSNL
ncbi:MAG: N-acetylmuramoyl-L-alanine amidase [Akkermansiaceae bacterium]|nr:N-acetylmuramoyl-L-alanine amidase [Akkermansiaceae bacterium]